MKTKSELTEENARLRRVLREAIEELLRFPVNVAPADKEVAEAIAAKASQLGVSSKSGNDECDTCGGKGTVSVGIPWAGEPACPTCV